MKVDFEVFGLYKIIFRFSQPFHHGFCFFKITAAVGVDSHGIRRQRELFVYLFPRVCSVKTRKINPLDKLFVNSIVSEVLKLNSSRAADLSCAGNGLSHTFQFN